MLFLLGFLLTKNYLHSVSLIYVIFQIIFKYSLSKSFLSRGSVFNDIFTLFRMTDFTMQIFKHVPLLSIPRPSSFRQMFHLVRFFPVVLCVRSLQGVDSSLSVQWQHKDVTQTRYLSPTGCSLRVHWGVILQAQKF